MIKQFLQPQIFQPVCRSCKLSKTIHSKASSGSSINLLKQRLQQEFNCIPVHPREQMEKQYQDSQAAVQNHYLFSENALEKLPFDMYFDRDNKLLYSFIQFQDGKQLGNTQGYVHGGLLSAIFDGALGSLFTMAGVSGFTANLNVDYRKPVSIPNTLLLRAHIESHEGRKLWIHGSLTSAALNENGYGEGEIYVEGKGLFLEQKK